jgi:hypothetical protein
MYIYIYIYISQNCTSSNITGCACTPKISCNRFAYFVLVHTHARNERFREPRALSARNERFLGTNVNANDQLCKKLQMHPRSWNPWFRRRANDTMPAYECANVASATQTSQIKYIYIYIYYQYPPPTHPPHPPPTMHDLQRIESCNQYAQAKHITLLSLRTCMEVVLERSIEGHA